MDKLRLLTRLSWLPSIFKGMDHLSAKFDVRIPDGNIPGGWKKINTSDKVFLALRVIVIPFKDVSITIVVLLRK